MFLDLNFAEREAYFRQMDGCLIPGYTGHCPMLKFRFGKSYGASTRQIIKELGERAGASAGVVSYEDPVTAALRTRPIQREGGQDPGEDHYFNQHSSDGTASRRYVLGYTGFIPGMSFQFGTSFGRAADATVALLQTRAAQQAARRAQRGDDHKPPPPQLSIRGRDVVPAAIAQADALSPDRYKDSHISTTLPPIAGYTGHIPRLKGTEASLSQRYHTAVTRGLELLQQERARRAQEEPWATQAATRAVHGVLASGAGAGGPRYSIPAY